MEEFTMEQIKQEYLAPTEVKELDIVNTYELEILEARLLPQVFQIHRY